MSTELQTHTSHVQCSLPCSSRAEQTGKEENSFKVLPQRLHHMSDFGVFNQILSYKIGLWHNHQGVSTRPWGCWEHISALTRVKYFWPRSLFMDVSDSRKKRLCLLKHFIIPSRKERGENKTVKGSGRKCLHLAGTGCVWISELSLQHQLTEM